MIRSLFTLAALALLLTFSPTTSAQSPAFSPEIRLLAHTTKMAEGKSVGIGAWLIEPNLLDTTPQAQATIGLRLEQRHGWIEILGGGVFSPTTAMVASPVLDVRSFAAPARHLHLFGEASFYRDVFYGFAQADIPIRRRDDVLFKLGVEAEGAKVWRSSGGFTAVGPHMILPWHEHFTTVIAVQSRTTYDSSPTVDTVGRVYAVINF